MMVSSVCCFGSLVILLLQTSGTQIHKLYLIKLGYQSNEILSKIKIFNLLINLSKLQAFLPHRLDHGIYCHRLLLLQARTTSGSSGKENGSIGGNGKIGNN